MSGTLGKLGRAHRPDWTSPLKCVRVSDDREEIERMGEKEKDESGKRID